MLNVSNLMKTTIISGYEAAGVPAGTFVSGTICTQLTGFASSLPKCPYNFLNTSYML